MNAYFRALIERILVENGLEKMISERFCEILEEREFMDNKSN